MSRGPQRMLEAAIVMAVSCLVPVVGCRPKPADPPGIWFGGKPVEHWLEEAASTEASRRCHAMDMLTNIGPLDPRALPAVIAALEDSEPAVRSAAVAGLSRLGPAAAAAVPALEGLQQDPDQDVRHRAAIALERVSKPSRQRNR